MIYVVATSHVKPESRDAFIKGAKEVIAATRQEKVASRIALELVRSLETFSARLDMRSQLIMEKK